MFTLIAAVVAPALAQTGCCVNLLDVTIDPPVERQVIGSTCIQPGGDGVIAARGANWFVSVTESCGMGFTGNQGSADVSLQSCGRC
ncbi:hypothetical protein K4K51_011148 [Neofusicoccum parvum]|uniref:Uncharacterized protein n=1 Tax=Neofusicoccum parvum TaxID=310453 RepID=A0ACB5SDX6_9PEZI|nr:hypothetical protein K4K51_011148 [Neofusicoccum parvum]